MNAPLIEVRQLVKHFPIRSTVLQRTVGTIKAVDDVSFELQSGETLAVVGESGCGKTTLGRAVVRLIQPTSGSVLVEGVDFARLNGEALRHLRRRLQIVFQDPYGSLDPRREIGESVAEGPKIHRMGTSRELRELAAAALRRVGLEDSHMSRFPHEFSGGQLQRIGIARAIAVGPKLIVADEPVSALDVSIQAQILNLMRTLQDELGIAYLFIVHNLGVVDFIAHRVAVMYLGRIVEIGTRDGIFEDPRHPYTVALLSAVPQADPRRRQKRIILRGEVPSPAEPPTGCHFHTRCWLRERLGNPERCASEVPALDPVSTGHSSACHFADRIQAYRDR